MNKNNDDIDHIFNLVKIGDTKGIKRAFKNGIDSNIKNDINETPLGIAVTKSNIDIVRILLENKADPNLIHKTQFPLFIAVYNNDFGIVKLLLNKGAYPNELDEEGNTALFYAIEKQFIDIVELILNSGADPDIKNNIGWTPLCIAASEGAYKIVKLLLNFNTNPDTKTNDGWTPLCIGASKGFNFSVKLLLDAKANPRILNSDGFAPLHLAVKYNHYNTANELIIYHSNLNLLDKDGNTPLILGVMQNFRNDKIIELLCENPLTNLDIQNSDGESALHIAVRSNKIPTIRILLNNDANINLQNKQGDTPLHIAAKYKLNDVIELLAKNYFLDKGIKNNEGLTAIEIIKNSNLEFKSLEDLEKIYDHNTSYIIVNKNLKELAISHGNKYYVCNNDLGFNFKTVKFKPLLYLTEKISYYINTALLLEERFENEESEIWSFIENYGELLAERKQNHSPREVKELINFEDTTLEFNLLYPVETIFTEHNNILSYNFKVPLLLFQNEYSLIIDKNSNYYSIYSLNINYKNIICLKSNIEINEIEAFANIFFYQYNHNSYYKILTIIPDAIKKIDKKFFFNQNKIFSDKELLKNGNFTFNIPDTNGEFLDLEGWKFQDEEIKQLNNYERLKDIRILNLNYNHISQAGLHDLLNNMKLSSLKVILLEHNNITLRQGDDLLSTNRIKNLEHLDLYQKELDSESLAILAGLSRSKLQVNIEVKSVQNVALHQIVKDGGLSQHYKNIEIKRIINSLYEPSAPLRKNLSNALLKIQFLHGVHGTFAVCKDGETNDCIFSLGSTGYTILKGKIKEFTEQYISKIVHNTLYLSHYLGKPIDSKFVNKALYNANESILEGAFDIIDIIKSTHALLDCYVNENNECTNKMKRDETSTIIFSSIAFLSSTIFTFLGEEYIDIEFNFGLMVLNNIYNGVSSIIEFEETNKLTYEEDWSVIWRTILFQPLPDEITDLLEKTKEVELYTENVWKYLKNSNTAAYAFGLGNISKDQTNKLNLASSIIDMSHKNDSFTRNLSRVSPKNIEQAKLLCLPTKTNQDYDQYDTVSNPDAVYYCDNAIVIADTKKYQFKTSNSNIFYDLKLINSGEIVGNNEFINNFKIYNGTADICGGNNTINFYNLNTNNFKGGLINGINSTDIIRVDEKLDKTITLDINNINAGKIYYYGSRYSDIVSCNESLNSEGIVYVDTKGSLNLWESDTIYNCKNSIINFNTNFYGLKNNYTLFVNTKYYLNENTYANIEIEGFAILNFFNTDLLRSIDEVTYIKENNILKLNINININYIFKINIQNYLNKDNYNIPNYVLIDKHGNNIVPKLLNDSSISSFEIYNSLKNRTAINSNDIYDVFEDAKEQYDNIVPLKNNFSILGFIKYKLSNLTYSLCFGSSDQNIFIIDENVNFISGGNGSDVYIFNNISQNHLIYINNEANDLKIDFLEILPNKTIVLAQDNNDLNIVYNNLNNTIVTTLINYCLSPQYQHLLLVNESGEYFIPFKLDNKYKLLPFYRASVNNTFTLNSTYKEIVIDSDKNLIKIFKNLYNAVVLSYANEDFKTIKLILVLKDYFLEPIAWENFKLFIYHINEMDLQNYLNITALIEEQNEIDYNEIFKVYEVDSFQKDHVFFHNQIGTIKGIEPVNVNDEKVGIIKFYNVYPHNITFRNDDKDCIITHNNFGTKITIKNFYKDISNINTQINIFEFNGINTLSYSNDIILYYFKNLTYTLQAQNVFAKAFYDTNLKLSNIGNQKNCYDGDLLKCILLRINLDVPNIHIVFGLNSLLESLKYTQYCVFRIKELQLFKDCINNNVIELYKKSLVYNLFVKGYPEEEITEYKKIINNFNSSSELKEIIGKLLNGEHHISSRDLSKQSHNFKNYLKFEEAEAATNSGSTKSSIINDSVNWLFSKISASISNMYDQFSRSSAINSENLPTYNCEKINTKPLSLDYINSSIMLLRVMVHLWNNKNKSFKKDKAYTKITKKHEEEIINYQKQCNVIKKYIHKRIETARDEDLNFFKFIISDLSEIRADLLSFKKSSFIETEIFERIKIKLIDYLQEFNISNILSTDSSQREIYNSVSYKEFHQNIAGNKISEIPINLPVFTSDMLGNCQLDHC